MKYLVKYVCELEYEVDVSSTEDALGWARANKPARSKLHGVVRADIGWPDTNTEAQRPPPPRGAPPSGTPAAGAGSAPMVDQTEEFVFARVAA